MIDIIKKPYIFSTSENPIVWAFSSDSASSGIIILRILDPRQFSTGFLTGPTLPILYESKIYATDFGTDSTKKYYVDLQPQLDSLVNFRMENSNYFMLAKNDNYFMYIVQATEYTKVNGVWLEGLSSYYSSPHVVYKGNLDILQYQYAGLFRWNNIEARANDMTRFLMSSKSVSTLDPGTCGVNKIGQFLTNRPRPFKINKFSTNQLWFLSNFYYCRPYSGGCDIDMKVVITEKETGNLITDMLVYSTTKPFELQANCTVSTFTSSTFTNSLAIVKVNDPVSGLTTLYSGNPYPGTVSYNTYITKVVNEINKNPLGYYAEVQGKTVKFYAPLGYYATINGNLVYFTGRTIDNGTTTYQYTRTGTFDGGGETQKYIAPVSRLQFSSPFLIDGNGGLDFNVNEGQDFCVQLKAYQSNKQAMGYLYREIGNSPTGTTQFGITNIPWRVYYSNKNETEPTGFRLSGNTFNTTKIYINKTSEGLLYNDFGDIYENAISGDSIAISNFVGGGPEAVYIINSKLDLGTYYQFNVTYSGGSGSFQSGIKYYISWWGREYLGTPGDLNVYPYPPTESCEGGGSFCPISEKLCFKWEEVNCDYEYVNILFSNAVGGVDTIQLINPREKRNYKKTYFNQNKLELSELRRRYTGQYIEGSKSLHQENFYSDDYFGYTYNTINGIPDKITLNSSETVVVELTTQPLTDAESNWLIELFKSKDVYICYETGVDDTTTSTSTIIPVQILESNYQIKNKRRLTNEFIQYDITFEFPKNYKNFINKITNQT